MVGGSVHRQYVMPLPTVKGGMYAFILTFGVVWEIVIYCLLRNQSCRYIFYWKQLHTTKWEKIGICFGLLSHYHGLTKDIEKMLYTALGARSPSLYVIIHYKCI